MLGLLRKARMNYELDKPPVQLLNNAVTYLEMWFRRHEFGCGSGFFWLQDGRTILISNWHNFSGRQPSTGKPMSATAGIPDRIRFTAYKRTSEPNAAGQYAAIYQYVHQPLYSEDWTGPLWREHSKWGATVDVGALDVTSVVEGYEIRHANVVEGDAILAPTTSQDVFVVELSLWLTSWRAGTCMEAWNNSGRSHVRHRRPSEDAS